MNNRGRTLEEIEGEVWGNPEFHSHVVTRRHQLRKLPIREFTIEDFRLMIAQRVSLETLVPLAIVHLDENPLVSGDFFRGDLLKAVLSLESSFWAKNPALFDQLNFIMADLKEQVVRVETDLIPLWLELSK